MQVIEPNVVEILRSATIEGVHVRLTSGQLPRKTYEAVNDVLSRLGGRWVGRKTSAHVFDEDPRPLLEDVIATGQMPKKNPFAYFPTPAAIARQMVDRAIVYGSETILEPSAGEGAICDVIRAVHPEAVIRAVEIDAKRYEVLRTKGYDADRANFLDWRSAELFDVVLMNPPFAVDGDPLAYMPHIEKAWTHLRPSGTLIAIAPPNFAYRSDRRSIAFRAFVQAFGEWDDLPSGAFSASGTEVNTVVITMQK
jgi:predicted RNA methylase